MKAELLLHHKQWISPYEFVEMKIWRVPCSVPPCDHDYKYSLVLVRNGRRIIGFDNERGKGDHLHLPGGERAYRFTNTDALIEDFLELLEEYRTREPKTNDHHR